MPVLYHYKDHNGVYARARIQKSIITYQITEAGREALAKAGISE